MTSPFPDELTFAEPAVFWLLTFSIPLIFLKIAADRKASQASRRFVSSRRMRKKLVAGAGINSWLVFGLRLTALSLFIVALARPQKGEFQETVQTEGRNILIAIDTSKSMLAADIQPDRLSMAKLAAEDVVESMGGDRIGLIAFAGRAYLHIPLTVDHASLNSYIRRLDTDSAPRGGSNLGLVIELALQTFDNDLGGSHALIIFTDGDELEGSALESAEKAKDRGILIITVGTGTDDGEIIPDPDKPGGYIKDENGKIVRTRLHSDLLKAIASKTDGLYLDLTKIKLSSNAVSRALNTLSTETFGEEEETRRKERYQVPMAIGFVCLLASFLTRMLAPVRIAPAVARSAVSNAALILAFCTFLWTGTANAESIGTKDPKSSYENGEYEIAHQAYKDLASEVSESGKGGIRSSISKIFNGLPKTSPAEAAQWYYGAGAAAYRSGDLEGAQKAFSNALQAEDPAMRSRAHHGMAGTLFHRGVAMQNVDKRTTIVLWNEALEHYDETIALDPLNKVAPKNAAYIRNQLDKLQKTQQANPQGGGESDPQEQDNDPNSPPESEQNNEKNPEEGSGDQNPSEQENPDKTSEEGSGDNNQDQAPDEPGTNEEKDPDQEPGEESKNNPDGEEKEPKKKSPAQLAREAVERFADEAQGIDLMPKSFRSRGFKDW